MRGLTRIRRIIAGIAATALLCAACPGAQAAALGYESYFDRDTLMRIDITVPAENWQSMLDSAMREEYIQCDAAINGERVTAVGIRCKGNSSLSMTKDERYSFKIDFNQYVRKQSFHGLDKLALNNTQSDYTFMKEYLSYCLMELAGVKTPLFNLAEIYVNDEYWGLYLAVECIDEAFIERNFDTNGGFLYKPDGTGEMGGRPGGDNMADRPDMDGWPGREAMPDMSAMTDNESAEGQPDMGGWPGAGYMPDMPAMDDRPDMPETGDWPGSDDRPDRGGMPDMSAMTDKGGFGRGGWPGIGGSSDSAAALGYLGDDISLYGDIFDYYKTNEPSEADKARLVASLKAMSEGNLQGALDVDGALAWLAANAVLVNSDGYLGSMLHNYYLYELNGELTVLPWDYNLAFGGFAGGSASSCVNSPVDTPASSDRPLVAALLADEENIQAYHAILEKLAAFLTDGSMDALIDEVSALIDEAVRLDPTKEGTYEQFTAGVETLRAFCRLRGESIEGQLAGSIPSTTAGQKADASALIEADLNLSDMGSQGGGRGGGFERGGFGNMLSGRKGVGADESGAAEPSDHSALLTGGDAEGMPALPGGMTPPTDGQSVETSAQAAEDGGQAKKRESRPIEEDGRSGGDGGQSAGPDNSERTQRGGMNGGGLGGESGGTDSARTADAAKTGRLLTGASALILLLALAFVIRFRR